MKFESSLTLAFAALLSTVSAQSASCDGYNPADWVTYTKIVPGVTTVTVTSYDGTDSLTGPGYTTASIPISEDGAYFTKVITERVSSYWATHCAASSSSSSSSAAVSSTTDADWVTYTKTVPGVTTVVVTRYVGTSSLTGTGYTTEVFTKSSNGTPIYTETVIVPVASSSAASSSTTDADWVTYTKTVPGVTTVVVTRYVGTSTLTGTGYTTEVFTKSSNGTPIYTETVIVPVATETADADASSSSTTDADWVTYTKTVPGVTTVVVTRYVGTSSLTGTGYTTEVFTKSSNGTPIYTETVIVPVASSSA